jgi:ribonuclease R
MHGDRAVARIISRRGPRRTGQIVQIVQRARDRVIGVYRQGPRDRCVVPQDVRIPYTVTIPRGAAGDAIDGYLVVAAITHYPTATSDIEASVVRTLGPASDPRVETDAVIATHDLPIGFPPGVETAAARVPSEVSPAARAGRLDLRRLPIVTIDGENARDFDDAVAIEPLASHRVRLTVAVADVDAYVRAGSALDQEAAERGTSVYFPDRVIPMLPEPLSNGICSLQPGVDRLVKVALLDLSVRGELVDARFADAVIRSTARLTYTEVGRMLVDRDQEVRARHAALVEPLERMEELCRALMERRQRRGSIDFDIPEAQIILDLRGRPENIVRAERTIAHRIIEQFMLTANEAVAQHLTARNMPMLYRVHEPPAPDAVANLATFLEGFGLRLQRSGDRPDPQAYRRVLEHVAGRPEERLVNRVLLRSLTQARYAVDNLGHFGLAADCYTHFTSPIRRYPDLVVHRMLAAALQGPITPARRDELATMLPAIAAAASRRERVAMDAEREIVALKKVQFMRDKVGQTFGGFVSDVTRFGFFVELDTYFVDGLVHVSTLTDDFYEHVERAHLLRGRRRRRTFRVGDRIRVRVAAVNIDRRQIELALES